MATHYTREFLFVGERGGLPLVVPFLFSVRERDALLDREARGWLGHGTEWDAFFRERWSTPASSGVWRVLPYGDLRVLAGGPADVESLVFRRGERLLRLTPEILRSSWAPSDEIQYRIYEGRLDLAGQQTRGSVLESYRVQRGSDGSLLQTGALDWMFVTDGGSVNLLLAEAMGADDDPGKTFAWTVTTDSERSWSSAEIRWMEMLPVEQARRDVPVAWSFRVPGAGMEGEVFSLGNEMEVGPDRPGRRSVLLRHNIEGWVSLGDERVRVFGLLRHSQN